MTLNYLVIGGAGFIGSHITRQLTREGHYVRVLSRRTIADNDRCPGVLYQSGDYAEPDCLNRALSEVDVVVHSASSTVPSTSNQNPSEDVRSNLIATLTLLDAMKARSIKRIAFISSGGTVYGNAMAQTGVPINEQTALNPRSSYGVVKVAIEQYLLMYQQLYDFQPLIVRAANPFGPGQNQQGIQGLFAIIFGCIQQGQPLKVWGDGETIRDYLFIDDLVDFMLRALKSNLVGIYNAGSGIGTSVNQAIQLASEVSGQPVQIDYRPQRDFDVQSVVLDISKAKRDCEWLPQHSIDEGLRKYWQKLAGQPIR